MACFPLQFGSPGLQLVAARAEEWGGLSLADRTGYRRNKVAVLGNEQEVFSVPVRQATQKTFHELVCRARGGEARRREGFCTMVWDDGVEESLQRQSQDTAADCKPQDLFPGWVQGPHPLITRNSGGLLPGLSSLRLLCLFTRLPFFLSSLQTQALDPATTEDV